jgi:hypothetical protein
MVTSGLGPEQQEEVLREIGQRLTGVLPPGWARATLTWSAVVGGGALASLSAVDGEGRSVRSDLPDGLGGPCGRLKNGMYRPGAGTWFTMTFELSADGSYTAGFDYDGEPEMAGYIPEHFLKEVARFPRDPEHVPDWLAKVLDRVPNVYVGVYAESGERYAEEFGPDTREVAEAFGREGWDVGPGEFRGEFEFTADWVTLRTLSSHGLVRLAGKIDPDRWEELVAFFTRQDWRFGATLYSGEEIVAEAEPRPEPGSGR